MADIWSNQYKYILSPSSSTVLKYSFKEVVLHLRLHFATSILSEGNIVLFTPYIYQTATVLS